MRTFRVILEGDNNHVDVKAEKFDDTVVGGVAFFRFLGANNLLTGQFPFSRVVGIVDTEYMG